MRLVRKHSLRMCSLIYGAGVLLASRGGHKATFRHETSVGLDSNGDIKSAVTTLN
jgi:hypothetical protein